MSHEAEARRWMAANPHTMHLMAVFAKDAKQRGVPHMGIAFLVERIRWFGIVEKRDAEGYKINNNHRAWIARELMARNPELDGYFTLRSADGDGPHLKPEPEPT